MGPPTESMTLALDTAQLEIIDDGDEADEGVDWRDLV
jgi:hypothetical protein